jgi:uncharacterized membrane protein HdeD (DUF308 family)
MPNTPTSIPHRWWVYLLRGLAGIVFGILTFVAPGSSLLALVILFGAYAVVDGALNLGLAVRGRQVGGPPWPSLVLQGVASMVAGVVSFIFPGMSALVLLLVIAAWSVVTGITAIAAAIRLRKEIRGEWLLALSGALSAAFGILLFLFPTAGALAVVIWIGAYAIVYGGVLVALSIRLRSRQHAPERQVPTGGGVRVGA